MRHQAVRTRCPRITRSTATKRNISTHRGRTPWRRYHPIGATQLIAQPRIRFVSSTVVRPLLVLATRMAQWDVPYRQGVLDAMALLRGQWTVAVLSALALGETQYKDLRLQINSVEERLGWSSHDRPLSERVLTDTLRRAQINGLVERRAESGRFSAVWYRLTPTGRSLLGAVRPLAEWAQQHRAEIMTAQQGANPSGPAKFP